MLTHRPLKAGPDTQGFMGVTLFQQEDYNLTLPRFLKTWQLGIKRVVPVQNEKRSFEISTFYAQKWLRNYS